MLRACRRFVSTHAVCLLCIFTLAVHVLQDHKETDRTEEKHRRQEYHLKDEIYSLRHPPTSPPPPHPVQARMMRLHSYAKRRILYYHFHKCGGHTMCKMARQNREKFLKTNDLCFDGTWDWNGPQWSMFFTISQSCVTQEQEMLKTKATYISMEFWFNWLQNCSYSEDSQMVTMTMLRQPISRLASQFSHDKIGSWLPPEVVNMTPQAILKKNPTDFFIDNYQTRRILNLVGSQPLRERKLQEREMRLAEDLLRNIDIVIPLERLCEAGPLLEYLIGWKQSTIPTAPVSVTRRGGAERTKLLTFERDAWPELEAMNEADMRLYKLANEHFDQQLEFLSMLSDASTLKPVCPQFQYSYLPYRTMPDIKPRGADRSAKQYIERGRLRKKQLEEKAEAKRKAAADQRSTTTTRIPHQETTIPISHRRARRLKLVENN